MRTRTALVAWAVVFATTAGGVAVVHAHGSPTAARTVVIAAPPEHPATTATQQHVGPVPSVAPSAHLSAEGQAVTQVVQVAVIGGPLELASDQATVVLERVPGSKADWVGTLPPVRVVDARGTHEGWDVRWAVGGVDVDSPTPNHVPAAKVHLEPGEPVVVAGLPDGLAAGKGGPGVPKGRVLFSAEPGSGGGTYEAGGTVSVRLPSSVDASAVTVRLTFTLD